MNHMHGDDNEAMSAAAIALAKIPAQLLAVLSQSVTDEMECRAPAKRMHDECMAPQQPPTQKRVQNSIAWDSVAVGTTPNTSDGDDFDLDIENSQNVPVHACANVAMPSRSCPAPPLLLATSAMHGNAGVLCKAPLAHSQALNAVPGALKVSKSLCPKALMGAKSKGGCEYSDSSPSNNSCFKRRAFTVQVN